VKFNKHETVEIDYRPILKVYNIVLYYVVLAHLDTYRIDSTVATTVYCTRILHSTVIIRGARSGWRVLTVESRT